jgi:hypothetical protein
MGTTLTGTTPQDTYDSLIKVTDNGPLSGTAKYLSDGLGNDSALALSTTAVGIGTNAPSAELQVNKASDVTLALSNSTAVTSGSRGSLAFYNSGVSTVAIIRATAVTDNVGTQLEFFTRPAAGSLAQNMTLTSTGNVGIGTASPAQKLGIDGSIILQSSTAASKSLIFNSPASNWGPQNSRIDFIPADGVNAAVDISLNLWDGNGFIKETLRFPSTGGIQFPATQISSANANTLDDYEEGTWTMGIAFGGASVGVTADFNSGTYTKIGRQVTVNGYLQLSSKGSSTGAATITGLPFTVANSTANYSAPSLRFNNITFTNQFQGFANINTTTIILGEITILGAETELSNADFANNSTIMVSLTYFV